MEETQVVEAGAAAPATTGAETEPKPADQEGATPTIPKPRFDEVLGQKKAAEDRAAAAERQLAEARAAQAQSTAQAPQKTPTFQEVQAAYDKGQITEAQKDQWLVYLATEQAKQQVAHGVTQAAALTKAQATAADYTKAYPSLNDAQSQEFRDLSHHYNELLALGHPENLITQAMALRMTFGPLKAGGNSATRDHTRERADTFLEGAGGGGHMAERDNPLKDVPERQIAYWKQQGYTKEQMIREAQIGRTRNIDDFRRMKAKKA